MFLLLKELSPPDGLPARTHPLGRGVFNETPSLVHIQNVKVKNFKVQSTIELQITYLTPNKTKINFSKVTFNEVTVMKSVQSSCKDWFGFTKI